MEKRGMTGIEILIAFIIGALIIYVAYTLIFKGLGGIESVYPAMNDAQAGVCQTSLKLSYQIRGKEVPKEYDLDNDGIYLFCDSCECITSNCKNDISNDKDKDGYYFECDLKDDDSKSGPSNLCKEQYKTLKRCCYSSGGNTKDLCAEQLPS